MILRVVSSCRSLLSPKSSTSSISYPCFISANPWPPESAPLHLPVFNELRWNLFQESRWPLENVAIAATQTHMRKSEVKLVLGARDRDVKQTPLFLERIAR